MKKSFITLLFIILCTYNIKAQDYISYNRISNRVDECILEGDLKGAAVKLDSLCNGYSFMFARHCFKALQIACELC